MIALAAAALFGAASARAAGLRGEMAIAVGAAFGLGAESATFAAALLAGGPRAVPWAEAGLALVGIALVRLRPGTPLSDPPPDPAPRWLRILFAAACAIAAAAFAEHTFRFPDGGWDSWMIWNLRARFLYRGGEGFRAAFSPSMVYLVHQDYPFLLPGLVAQGFQLASHETKAVPISIAFLFGALLVAATVTTARHILGARWALLAGLALLALPAFPTFAADQQSDVPLALYLLLATAFVELRRPLLAGFAGGLAIWTKNEGALYCGLLAVALAWRWRDLRAALRFLLGASPFLVLFALYKLFVAPATDLAALSTRASVLHHAFDPRRWLELFALLIRRTVYVQHFALWIVAEIAALWLLRRQRPGPVATALLLSCAVLIGIYLVQPFPLQWIVRTSVDRLVMQLWPAAVLCTATALMRAQTTPRTSPSYRR